MLDKENLLDVKGGAAAAVAAGTFKIGAKIAAIIGGVIFIIGAIDGYLRPLKCRK